MLYDGPTLKANSVDWIRDARDAKVFTQKKKQKTRPLQILGVAEKLSLAKNLLAIRLLWLLQILASGKMRDFVSK